MLFSVFDLWILIDRCHLCVPTVHCEGTSRYKIIQIPEVPLQSRKLCITNKYKYKIHNKIYPIQHSARSGKRCIEVTNRDEYKNITTRNVGFFSLSIMDIVAYTMTLQTNCRDQTFVSIVTFHELQSVSVMDARI